MRNILPLHFEFSSKIGVRETPQVDSRHQSNVKGLYIIGDLADAPIIKVALNQGFSVAKQVWREDLASQTGADADVLDFLIIGAGPAGIGAALALQDTQARYLVVEKERPFATIQNFPRSKLIFSEPREMQTAGNFWFEDASTEELIERWDQALKDQALNIEQPCAVTQVTPSQGGFDVYCEDGSVKRARRVLLATGRRGNPRRLGVTGEDSEKVRYNLQDPAAHQGQQVLVVGGGDSAVETACDIADAGGQVTLSYRKDSFSRPKAKNKERVNAYREQGKLRVALSSHLSEIHPDRVVLQTESGTIDLPNDQVIVQIGTTLATSFLARLGVRMQGHMDALRASWIVAFGLITWCFYILKGGTEQDAAGLWVAKKAFFPFGEGQFLEFLPGLLRVDLGFRVVDGAFWGTLTYSLLILVFGIRAYLKYPAPIQKKRYISLITFQLLFLFGIPELLAPAVISFSGEGGWAWQIFGGDRAWKFYGLSVPWPLNIWALIDAPNWTATGSTRVVLTWLGLTSAVSFIGIPLFVRKHGERFCSWACGCGGLAETLGDLWRHLAPRGATSYRSEWAGRVIFLLAIPTTALICADAWGLLSEGLQSTKGFAEHWYPLMVDFWLASVVGVALYPYLGNRVWCRFFCPLRAYMEMLAKRFSKITILSKATCIGCGECTRYCQMGIDVQSFAQRQRELDNRETACIQCGICIQVCPMEVLSIGERGQEIQLTTGALSPGPGVAKG